MQGQRLPQNLSGVVFCRIRLQRPGHGQGRRLYRQTLGLGLNGTDPTQLLNLLNSVNNTNAGQSNDFAAQLTKLILGLFPQATK